MTTPEPLRFARRDDHRVVAGVAGGFADQHGVDPFVVRGALVVLCFTGGLGAVLYAAGYFFSQPPGSQLPPAHPPDQRRSLAVGCITIGVALVVRSTGLWLGDVPMVPLIVVVAGIALSGALQPDAGVHGAWGPLASSPLADVVAGKHARARVVAGAALIALGLVLVGLQGGVSGGLQVGVYATAITIFGVAVLLGPWLARAAQEVAAERRQRIRSEEREAMAAHLHDSVLQTLALIQRNADDPRRTVTLARRQERELREWLYGTTGDEEPTIAGAVKSMAHEVEGLYDIRIEIVMVGDRPMDEGAVALVAAMREASVNAAKHSGVDEVSVFVEVGTEEIEAFVRDRGCGFERDNGPTDRRGIAQSIEARIERAGGSATIESSPGHGTEVHLVLPIVTSEETIPS
ncbi:MAG: PspC domain-containing protein [Acidimicrobiia bacterium]